METVYYTLNARRVSCCGMASGEAVPRRSYAVLRRAQTPQAGEYGKVVDFTAYRQAIDIREEEAPAEIPEGPESACTGRVSRAFLALELMATMAVIAMAAAVILAFLPLLSSV